jgi:hypothetical protein
MKYPGKQLQPDGEYICQRSQKRSSRGGTDVVLHVLRANPILISKMEWWGRLAAGRRCYIGVS